MNVDRIIDSLNVRIEHNRKELAECERLHGEEVKRDPSAYHSAHSEMRDWHLGKLEAYKVMLQMIQEAQ